MALIVCLQARYVLLESAEQQTRTDRGSVWVGELLQEEEEGSWLCVPVNDSKAPKQLSCEMTHVAIFFLVEIRDPQLFCFCELNGLKMEFHFSYVAFAWSQLLGGGVMTSAGRW